MILAFNDLEVTVGILSLIILVILIIFFLLSFSKRYRSESINSTWVKDAKKQTAQEKVDSEANPAFAEINRERKNIRLELIIKYAHEHGIEVDIDSQEPWLVHYFKYAAHVINRDLQLIWAKILVKQMQQPNSVSTKTLDVLKTINGENVRSFAKMTQLVVNNDFIFSDTILNEKYFSYSEIMVLQENDLINDSSFIPMSYVLNKGQKFQLDNGTLVAVFENINNAPVTINFPTYKLSKVGSELTSVIDSKPNDQYFIDNIKDTKQRYRNLVNVAVYKIASKNGETIRHDQVDLIE